MSEVLDKTARRIIGVLIEKQLSTPNLYPLSQNALTNGCNQRSNRNPVVTIEEFEVEGALRNLYVHEWATNVTGAGSRVLKWKHRAHEKLNLSDEELPIMGELLLRGAQTAGELRSRVARMRKFASLEILMEHVEELRNRGLITLLGPTAGRRAQLYDHTLYLDEETPHEEVISMTRVGDVGAVEPLAKDDLTKDLEAEIASLKTRIQRIEDALDMNDPDTEGTTV
ncbi:MAG: hypothetical protein ACI97A_002783 [Planctomycetota bacterium]|jgi:uncharacterized protein YceH (UPF0502 family)